MSFIITFLTLITAFPFSASAEWRREETAPGTAVWKYYDESGNYRTGDFIDSDGNIYFLNSDGTMVSDYYGSYLRYYGKDGALKNYGSDPDGTKRSLSERYLAGELISFTRYDEMCEWWKCFNQEYNDYDMIDSPVYEVNGPTYRMKPFADILAHYYGIPPTVAINVRSEAVQNAVKDMASRVTGETVEEKVASAIKEVANFLEYDDERIETYETEHIWTNYGLDSIVERHKAICKGYAMLTLRVLREAGIESEIVGGTLTKNNGTSDDTGCHAWLRIDVNQGTGQKTKWMFADPTWYDTHKEEGVDKDFWLNISYAEYMWSRRMEGYWTEDSHRYLVY